VSKPKPEGELRITWLILIAVLSLLATACSGDDSSNASTTATDARSPGAAGASETPARGKWRTLAPMPTPRSEVAAAALDGKIYVVGGFEADGAPSAKVEGYDPATNTWAEAARLPEPRHHAAAAAMGGLYVLGGFGSTFQDARADVFLYTPSRNEWTAVDPLVNARGGHGAAVIGFDLYAVGGARAGPADGLENVAPVERYDPRSGEWGSGGDLPTPRDHLAAVNSAGALDTIGGRLGGDSSKNLSAHELLSDNGWETRAPLPTARSGIAAVELNGLVYVFGGEAPTGTFNIVDAYNSQTDSWETMPPMPTARHGLGAAVVGDTIYVIGGGPTPGLSVSGANEAFTP